MPRMMGSGRPWHERCLRRLRVACFESSEAYEAGRPILVGTTSIESSERLARDLELRGVPYYLLNAKPENADREAATRAPFVAFFVLLSVDFQSTSKSFL